MPKKTVLLLAMALDFGGAETHVVSLAKALNKLGLRVVVVSNGGRLVPELTAAGIRHHRVALHARKPWALLKSIGSVRRLAGEEGVVLMHAHARIPAWVARWVGKAGHIPLVTTYHGLYNPHWLLRLFTAAGQETIAVSRDVRQHLMDKFGVPSSQISLIYNGIDMDKFAADGAGNPWQIIYISRMAGARGRVALEVMQAAASLRAEFPLLHTVIVGEGELLPQVEALAGQLNEARGEDFCSVLGGRADIPRLLAEAGVVVGVGRVVLEAMASGRPAIVAGEYGIYGLLDEKTLPLAMEHNFSGRGAATATNAASIAAALRAVLIDYKRAQAEALAVRAVAASHYSVDEKAKQVLAVYEKLVPDLSLIEEERI